MSEVITFVFSLLIASFVVSKYFSYIEIDEELKCKSKDNFNLTFWISFFAYGVFFVGVVLTNVIVIIGSLTILCLILLKELVITINKINYYDKEFKLILKKENLRMNKEVIKKEMVKDSIKNNFYLLSSPFILLEKGIKNLLKIIFK